MSIKSSEALLVEATNLAWRWHGHQTRKGKTTSYMSHLLHVQALVLDFGGGAEEAIAALLHDSLEDANDPAERAAREEEIGSTFGPGVMQTVLDCTDTTKSEAGERKGPWRERKERLLGQIRNASRSSQLVAACDKRHNLGDLISDLRFEGLETLARFNADGPSQIWYFEAIVTACRAGIPSRLATELDALVRELASIVETQDDGNRPT